ncbi:MAG: DUF2141 domain-containing protein [Pseudomonadota bacterium]
MRHATTCPPLLALSALVSASVHAASLDVQVTSIDEPKGYIMLAIFDSAEAFDNGGQPMRAVRVAVEGSELRTAFDDVPAGTYAVRLYHDANGNGELDTNMMGLPKEGYGFSNNGGRFGPPAFNAAAFEVTEDGTNSITIKLR